MLAARDLATELVNQPGRTGGTTPHLEGLSQIEQLENSARVRPRRVDATLALAASGDPSPGTTCQIPQFSPSASLAGRSSLHFAGWLWHAPPPGCMPKLGRERPTGRFPTRPTGLRDCRRTMERRPPHLGQRPRPASRSTLPGIFPAWISPVPGRPIMRLAPPTVPS